MELRSAQLAISTRPCDVTSDEGIGNTIKPGYQPSITLEIGYNRVNKENNGVSGIILYMPPTNKRPRYIVTWSLIGCAHTQNDPWVCKRLSFSKWTTIFPRRVVWTKSFCVILPKVGHLSGVPFNSLSVVLCIYETWTWSSLCLLMAWHPALGVRPLARTVMTIKQHNIFQNLLRYEWFWIWLQWTDNVIQK